MQIVETSVRAKLNGTCTGGTGPDLRGYPHLVYAPLQWGEGVRVASNGASVQEIAEWANGASADAELVYIVDEIAKRFSIAWKELFESLLYARANGMI